MRVFILFGIILFATSAQADSFSERREKMREVCLNQDWSKVTCNTAPAMNNGTGYKMSFIDPVVDIVSDDLIFQGVSSIKWFTERHILRNSTVSGVVKTQDRLLQEIKNELKVFAQKNNLSQCAKACLATCASSQLIAYDADTQFDAEYRAAYILYRGVGLCRHFSELADQLMGALNVKSRAVGGELYENGETLGGHAWVRVNLNGKKYWMEPQSSACVFMDPKQGS